MTDDSKKKRRSVRERVRRGVELHGWPHFIQLAVTDRLDGLGVALDIVRIVDFPIRRGAVEPECDLEIRWGTHADIDGEAHDRLGYAEAECHARMSGGARVAVALANGRVVSCQWLEPKMTHQFSIDFHLRPDEIWRTVSSTVVEYRGRGLFATVTRWYRAKLSQEGFANTYGGHDIFNRFSGRAWEKMTGWRASRLIVFRARDRGFVWDSRLTFEVEGMKVGRHLTLTRGAPQARVART